LGNLDLTVAMHRSAALAVVASAPQGSFVRVQEELWYLDVAG